MPKQHRIEKKNIFQSSEDEEINFTPSEEFRKQAYFSSEHQYKKIYRFSVEDLEKFWSNTANELHWFKQWNKIKQGHAFSSNWFVGAKTNINYNCLDVHLDSKRRNKAAIIWESEDGETKIYTYQLLFTYVCNFASALKKLGVKRGDNVVIYMGMVPEAVIAMLACMRIGAVHSVVYYDLSSTSLAKRINDLECKLIITQDFILNKGSFLPLKEKVDKAINDNENVKDVIIFNRFKEANVKLHPERDKLWQDVITMAPVDCDAVPLDSQHPAFSLFTNGPKGDPIKILHRTGGYMVQAYLSSKWIYDLKDEDIIWTTSRFAWISSHTYSIYGPLLNGVTTFLYEGNPVYPEPNRYWQLISKYRINIFNTSPTLLRAFLKLGDEWIKDNDLSSIRLLGIISEPVKPATWSWFYKSIGKERVPVVNTWMQTETGSIILAPMPGAAEMRPGLTCYPFPGVEIDIVDINGSTVEVGQGGYLIIKDSWPSMFTTEREEKPETKLNCWKQFKGNYFTGDAAIKEKNGFVRILGRVDDVIKAASIRVGGSEIENVLLSHDGVNEAAVVKRPDEVIGNAIIAYVSTAENIEENLLLKEELRNYVVENIGSLAKPDELNFISKMPRLEEGKINRRLLRKMSFGGIRKLKGREEEVFNIFEKLREDYQKIYLR
ncbi:acetate--CoA ligase [Bacteroidota bacterium]